MSFGREERTKVLLQYTTARCYAEAFRHAANLVTSMDAQGIPPSMTFNTLAQNYQREADKLQVELAAVPIAADTQQEREG